MAGLLAAVDEALARDAPDVAVALLRRALDEQTTNPSRAALLLKLGQVEVTRRDPAAIEILFEARQLLRDPHDRAVAGMGIGEIATFVGQWDIAADITEQLLEERDGLSDELTLEIELERALVCAFDPALVERFRQDRPRLRKLANGRSWPARALAAALAQTAAMGQAGHVDEVLPLCDHASAEGVLLSERGAGAFASGHVALALMMAEQYDRCLAFLDELEVAARAQGSVANALIVPALRGGIAVHRGDFASAEELVRPVIDVAAKNGILLLLVNLLFFCDALLLERPAQADLAEMVESLQTPPAFAEAAGGGWLLTVRGQLRAQQGERVKAEADLRQAVSIFKALDFGPAHARARSLLALVLRPEDRDEARALIEEELVLANATGLSRPRGMALRAAGLIGGGEEGIERLRQSVAVLSEGAARYEHARSLVELGAMLRRSRRRAEARVPLEEGMELAFHCGAERLLDRAREELLATGARPRNVVRSGFAALTPSERRVVRLAAEGRSNPEIAQTLYLSVKTVETHLSKAYRTLDLSGPGSRQRLAETVPELRVA